MSILDKPEKFGAAGFCLLVLLFGLGVAYQHSNFLREKEILKKGTPDVYQAYELLGRAVKQRYSLDSMLQIMTKEERVRFRFKRKELEALRSGYDSTIVTITDYIRDPKSYDLRLVHFH